MTPIPPLGIITGRGLHSQQHMQPVLRPHVCRLLDGLAPPLRWTIADGNDGHVVVDAGAMAGGVCTLDTCLQLGAGAYTN
jgi:hypothetical protein